jgi:hypothetical protein
MFHAMVRFPGSWSGFLRHAPLWIASTLSAAGFMLLLPGYAEIANAETASTDERCRLLPIAELESHFGARAAAVRESESVAGTLCSADIPDRRQGAELLSKEAGPAAPTMEERVSALKQPLELRGAELTSFGPVACFTDHTKIAGTKLFTATCFQEAGGYLSLSLRSEDRQRVAVEAVKQLLEKAALKRE